MDASPALGELRQPAFDRTFLGRLFRSVLWTVLLLVALAGVLVCVRRATGDLTQPLPARALAVLGLLLAAATILFRHSLPIAALSGWSRYAAWGVPTIVLVLWTLGIALPGTTTLGLALFVAPLVAEELWSWWRMPSLRAASHPDVTPWPAAGVGSRPAIELFEEPDSGELSDESVTQSIERRREPQGEVITGWTRVEFAAQQRHAAAHLAICPPLDRVPQCYAEPLDGPPSQVKIAQVLPHGVRLEVKLDEPAPEPTSVVVEFSIQEQPQS